MVWIRGRPSLPFFLIWFVSITVCIGFVVIAFINWRLMARCANFMNNIFSLLFCFPLWFFSLSIVCWRHMRSSFTFFYRRSIIPLIFLLHSRGFFYLFFLGFSIILLFSSFFCFLFCFIISYMLFVNCDCILIFNFFIFMIYLNINIDVCGNYFIIVLAFQLFSGVYWFIWTCRFNCFFWFTCFLFCRIFLPAFFIFFGGGGLFFYRIWPWLAEFNVLRIFRFILTFLLFIFFRCLFIPIFIIWITIWLIWFWFLFFNCSQSFPFYFCGSKGFLQ